MGQFEAKTSVEPDRVVVALAGECDLTVRDELAEALLAAVSSSPLVIVDVAALTFLDSSGVHGLVVAHQAAQHNGGRLYVINPLGVVATILDITGIGVLLRPPAGSDA